MKYQKEIAESLLNLGIIVDEDYYKLPISDVIEESLTFMSFIIEIEEKMCIDVPDEFLQQGVLVTFADVEEMINVINSQEAI